MKNIHISLSNCKHQSRLFKETDTLAKNKVFDEIKIVGLWEHPLEETQILDEVRTIHRVNLRSRSLPRSLPFQIIKYLEFTFYLLRNYAGFQVVNVHSLSLLIIGLIFKVLYGSRLIYDAHEYETEIGGLKGIRKILTKRLERLCIKYCDRTIVVSESIANEYKRLYPHLPKPYVVLNTPNYQEVVKKNLFREKFTIESDRVIFLYQGLLGPRGRGLELLLEVFKDPPPNTAIVFMGYGPSEELIKKCANEYPSIFFHEAVSTQVLLDYSSSADFGVSIIENISLSYYYCLPNKMFEYLMAGLPIVVSNLFEMNKLVSEYQIGIVAENNTVQDVRKSLLDALSLDLEVITPNIMKFKNIYNWEQQELVLLDVYNDLYSPKI